VPVRSDHPGALPVNKPIELEIEAPSADFMQDVTKTLSIFTTNT
jgi:hypothetical protein